MVGVAQSADLATDRCPIITWLHGINHVAAGIGASYSNAVLIPLVEDKVIGLSIFVPAHTADGQRRIGRANSAEGSAAKRRSGSVDRLLRIGDVRAAHCAYSDDIAAHAGICAITRVRIGQ